MKAKDRSEGLEIAQSASGWSQAEQEEESIPDKAFEVAEHSRYSKRDVVGTGGMGIVHRSRDTRLMRDVALKEVRPGRNESQLVREARLTANLEHPNIVPIYDGGLGSDGELFYTMRLIEGQSLGDAFRECGNQEQRLSLLRHYLGVCEGVAFAHDRGIVHRDLKPDNVMIGVFGETQIVDWGLAIHVDPKDALAFDAEIGLTGRQLSARAVGTRAYMSPEQENGDQPQFHFDVWSLGVILIDLINGVESGGWLEGESIATHIQARLAQRTSQRELKAICTKALHPDTNRRYKNASELAADVGCHLEGRRVAAHEYTTIELLQRLIARWKIPIAIATLALFLVIGVVAFSWVRVGRERNRALSAEVKTREALQTSTKTLARTLAQQALSALKRGASPEAEMFAVQSLQRVESPEARGVLAAVYAASRPMQEMHWRPPSCRLPIPTHDASLLCLGNREVSLWDPPVAGQGSGSLRWKVERQAELARITSDRVVLLERNALVLLDVRNGDEMYSHSTHDQLLAIDAHSETVLTADRHKAEVFDGRTLRHLRSILLCADDTSILALDASKGRVAAICSEGSVSLVELSNGQKIAEAIVPGIDSRHPGTSIAISEVENTIAIGDVHGNLSIVRWSHEPRLQQLPITPGTPIVTTRFLSTSLVAIVPEQGGTQLWNLDSASEQMRLPSDISALASQFGYLVAAGQGRSGPLVTRWRLPETSKQATFSGDTGLSSAALSPDGKTIAAGGGDGRLHIWSRSGSLPRRELLLSSDVVKRVAFNGEGTRLSIATADSSGLTILDTESWEVTKNSIAGRAVRRVAMLNEELAILVHYGKGVMAYSLGDERAERVDGPIIVDLYGRPERHKVALLSSGGEVLEMDESLVMKERFQVPGARAIAWQPAADRFAVALDAEVQIVSLDGTLLATLRSEVGALEDVAISYDGKWCAASSRSGAIEVWDLGSGVRRAVLRSHTQRVPFISFSPDGHLLSASWDGDVRLWDTNVLSMSTTELLAQANQAWGNRAVKD